MYKINTRILVYFCYIPLYNFLVLVYITLCTIFSYMYDSFLGYRCSAGIAHNKILAKLACGLHKPNKQTILPQDGVAQLYQNLPLRKIKSLGGKFGNSLSDELNIQNMGELERFSEQELMRKYDEKTA